MDNALSELTTFIADGAQEGPKTARALLESLFGFRYHKRHLSKTAIRDAMKLGTDTDNDQGVPYAGIINPDNPETGPYGGTSLVWFPIKDQGSIMVFCVGTRGISPDEGILTRPGHRRRISALRKMLASKGIEVWSKPDPANLGISVPKTTIERFAGFEKALKRYGREMYCIAHIKKSDALELTQYAVRSFLDLYSYERGWEIMAEFKAERESLLGDLRQDLFERVTPDLVYALLKERHFVIIQGPPGTGKTRLAELVKKIHFSDKGKTIQFHPSVTYEDFVIGLSPDIDKAESLRFGVNPGWLYQACQAANESPYLLVIDEINRADLGKILGESIYLFESDEIGKRTVELAHPVNGSRAFKLPSNLYVLGTMNTADRSIASVDLAIRRRFSFVSMMPEREVVAAQGIDLATQFFDRICDVFIEHAPQDALNLMPGHSYFIAKDKDSLIKRFRYELLPLLDEYLKEGYLGPATTELNAVRDSMADAVR
jgi:5-methylcytosine-specific restriction protein B